MKEQIVLFETAKLAQEKGFKEMANNRYCYLSSKELRREIGVWNYPEKIFPGRIDAPTQSLLQKWLREVHGIHAEVYHFTNQPTTTKFFKDCYQAFVNGEALFPYFEIYEDALEAAFVQSLDLIP